MKTNAGHYVIIFQRVCEVSAIFNETEDEVDHAICGDNVRLRLKNVEEDVSIFEDILS